MAERRWFRLDTTWSQSEWVASLEPAARLCWVEMLGYVKAHGFNGRAKKLATGVAARNWGVTRNDVTAMLDAAKSDDAVREDGEDWVITNWPEYQGDPTAAERNKRYRESKSRLSPLRGSRVSDVALRSVTATKTETKTKTEEKEKAPYGAQKKESGKTSGTPASDDGQTIVGPPVDHPDAAARKTVLPRNWDPNETHRRIAQEQGVDMVEQVEQFRDYEAARRRVLADWDAAFRNWLRNAGKFQGKNGHSRPSGNERLLKHAARISQIDLEQGRVFGD